MSNITRTKYSVISNLPLNEQQELCIRLCDFFSGIRNEEYRKTMGLKVKKNTPAPLSVVNFLNYHKDHVGMDLWSKVQQIKELISKLSQSKILTSYGGNDLQECFFYLYTTSTLQKLGHLWLGKALGSQYIGSEIEKDIAYITGTTPKDDISVGTGTLILPNVVLTCGHVVSDMKVDDVIIVSGQEVKVEKTLHHDVVDVGLILLKENIERKLPDLAFRDAALLEEVVIAGYPSIPRNCSRKPIFTLQRGEISGFVEETMDKYPLDLFSAIARPGNSGGPVVGLDGRIVGIVTRSLEREKEEADAMSPMPFFASVPASVIRDCVLELTENTVSIPWEDYS